MNIRAFAKTGGKRGITFIANGTAAEMLHNLRSP